LAFHWGSAAICYSVLGAGSTDIRAEYPLTVIADLLLHNAPVPVRSCASAQQGNGHTSNREELTAQDDFLSEPYRAAHDPLS
jgi:hypothetical protein